MVNRMAMRPLTKAIFEREGKSITGHRWTLDQVRQAYEKADDLLDYIVACKESSKSLKRAGLERAYLPDFEIGLEECLAENQTNEAVQNLSLGILRKLLGRGLDVLSSAARIYRSAPGTFKDVYASSKPAFLKDWSVRQKVPTNSFVAFKTGENPAMAKDDEISRQYARVYRHLNFDNWAKNDLYLTWLHHTDAGRKCYQETKWLQEVAAALFEKRLKGPSESLIYPMLLRNPRQRRNQRV